MTVTSNGVEEIGEASAHQVVPMSVCTCMTPAAPSPLPIPYPYKSDSGSLGTKTSKTKTDDKPMHSSFGKTSSGMGNEAGSAPPKDITVPGINKGAAWIMPVPHINNHKEGKPTGGTGNAGMGDSMK